MHSRSSGVLDAIGDPRALLEGLIEHSPVAYQVYRADGHCLLVNPAFRRLFGSEPPPEYCLFDDDILAERGFLELVRSAFVGQTVHVPPHWYDPRELRQIEVREGKRVGIAVTLFPLRDADGAIPYVALCFEDVTAELSLERRVAERTAELSVANRELEAFSYSVAHDLRAPLRGMIGFAEILLDDLAGRLDPEVAEQVRKIRCNALLMGELIDALLGLARLARSELQPTAVDLSAMARSVAGALAEAEPGRAVAIAIADGLRAVAEPALARTLLENLIGNAWKFTRATPEAAIDVGATERDGERALFVRDNGAGFDMAYADKLFVPFQRLHPAREFPGTGIGLATVRRIVDRHGGRVWAESRPGRGATFYVKLPG